MAAAAAAGTGAGRTLAAVGMNVNLAPVLDVYSTPGNFIDQYQRSYSANPGTVASLGRAFITAQQRTGVAATAKHFPGLGRAATAQNTDTRPITLSQSLATLRSTDELPYSAAVAIGVDLILCSARDVSQGEAATTALVNAQTEGQLDTADFIAAADRIAHLRARLH